MAHLVGVDGVIVVVKLMSFDGWSSFLMVNDIRQKPELSTQTINRDEDRRDTLLEMTMARSIENLDDSG